VYSEAIVIDASVAPVIDDDYVAKLKRSGVTAINWTVCHPWPWIGAPLVPTLIEIAAGIEAIEKYGDDLILVRSADDVVRAKREGSVAVIFGPQNARPAEEGFFVFRVLWEMGVRIVQLTYNERNLFGDGIAETANAGLSRLGRQAIEEMNRLGILIDLSHSGERTTLETIEASSAPVTVTHGNCRAIHDSPRNKTDDAIKAIGARGGVVGLSLWSPLLRFDRRPTLDDFIRHVDHVASLIGIEHCAIGSDMSEGSDREAWTKRSGKGGRYPMVSQRMGDWFNFDTRFPAEANSVVDLPNVAAALARLRLSDDEIKGVLGANFLRLCRTVWGA
jgi:membrane dipeptidase